jgi:TP53 regulating kinase-like protein
VYLTDVASGLVVMEKLAGPTAKEMLLALAAQEDLGGQLALGKAIGDTIARVHAGGLVHGDLTTSNMVVVAGGTAAPPLPLAADAEASSSSSSASASASGASKAAFEVALIDFGLTVSARGSQIEEDRGVDLYVMERAIISTHANATEVVDAAMAGYHECRAWQAAGDGPDSQASLRRTLSYLQRVRARGRKRLAFG